MDGRSRTLIDRCCSAPHYRCLRAFITLVNISSLPFDVVHVFFCLPPSQRLLMNNVELFCVQHFPTANTLFYPMPLVFHWFTTSLCVACCILPRRWAVRHAAVAHTIYTHVQLPHTTHARTHRRAHCRSRAHTVPHTTLKTLHLRGCVDA